MKANKAQEFHERMRFISERAERYMRAHGYEFMQHNGQRWSTLTSVKNPPSDQSKSEVFVGRIPRNMFEDEIFPHFNAVGPVYRVRLMMDFSGSNRGYGFIKFIHECDAERACQLLDDRVFRPNTPSIGVTLSFNNRRLFFSKLPAACTRQLLLKELNKTLDDVEDVEMIPPCSPFRVEFRSAIVVFKNHDAATQARRVICPGGPRMFGREIIVDWAKREDSNESRPASREPLKPKAELKPPSSKLDDQLLTGCLIDLNNNNLNAYPSNHVTQNFARPCNFIDENTIADKYMEQLTEPLAYVPQDTWLNFFNCLNRVLTPTTLNGHNSFTPLH